MIPDTLLGHVLKLGLAPGEPCRCSCGWTGAAREAGVHVLETITGEAVDAIDQAAQAGILP